MKKVILITAALLITGIASAQKANKKRFSSGFNLGINHANLLLNNDSEGSAETGIGFRVGLVSDFAFTKRVSFQPKAELAFNKINYRDESGEMATNPIDLELITHLKIRTKPCPRSFYFVLGPNLKIPLNSKQSGSMPTRQDLALDLGIGYDLGIGPIRISPELRYSIRLLNITESSSAQDLKFHNISLTLNFTGRPRL